jgi:hypothetical protein
MRPTYKSWWCVLALKDEIHEVEWRLRYLKMLLEHSDRYEPKRVLDQILEKLEKMKEES